MAPAISDELINAFNGVTGEPFPEVILQYLDHCNGNLEQALGMYLDEPEQSRTFTTRTYDSYLAKKAQKDRKDSYSEEAFTADRNNEMQMGMTAFDVHGEDVLSSSTEIEYASNAPTRPPSPNNATNGQETGVTGADGQSFIGPLPQNSYHYDPAHWALVPASSAAEIFIDPTADMRKRDIDLGEPVVMRPTREEPLANVVTILGHIPLARAILGGGSTTVDYGSSPEWWKGTKIKMASVSHGEEPHKQSAYDLKEETERLMAFLNSSTRSYGSVVPLSQLSALKNAKASDGVNIGTNAERFLTAWSEMAMQLNLYNTVRSANLFQTIALHVREGKEEDERPSFYIIDLKLEKNISSEPRTLYDGVDETLWAGDVDGTTKDNYCLHKFPPVLFMRVQNLDANRPGLDMDVPRTWYLDRYLEQNMEAAKAMRRKRSEYRQAMESLEERQAKLGRIIYPIKEKGRGQDNANEGRKASNYTFATSNVLQSTIDFLDPSRAVKQAAKKTKEGENGKKNEKSGESAEPGRENEKLIESDQNGVTIPEMKEAAPTKLFDPAQERDKQLAGKLAKICAQVLDKISELEKEREQVQIEMVKISKEFTGHGNPTHRYNLRGVSIGPVHTEQYVLVDPSSRLVAQQDQDEAVDVEIPSQWWQIQFGSEQPTKQKVDIESVLKAASETSRDVLLVYATDAACERRDLNLSTGLKTFVNRDNEYFSQEVAAQVAAYNDSMETDEIQQNLPTEPPPEYEARTGLDGRWALDDRNGPRDGEDVRMGGTSSERIEDVTDAENSEIKKGG